MTLWRHLKAFCATAVFMVFGLSSAAEQFDDIIVTPQSLHQGQTSHGYSEFRVLLENRSLKRTHQVTLVYPDRNMSSGNCISRLSRTVSLAPEARVSVALWQPALPTYGNGMLRVETDGNLAGTVPLPNANRHLMGGYRYGGASLQTTILVSRSLDHADVESAFQGRKGTYTASMATGAPDSGGGRSAAPTVWRPDPSSSGPHWLELVYSPSMAADHIRIYQTTRFSGTGNIELIGVSGTNLANIPLALPSGTAGRPSRPTGPREFSFPLTAEPVHTVRLEFNSGAPHNISIDAVEVAGPSGSAWASSAQASSDASAISPPTGGPGPGRDTRFCLRAELPVSEWSDQWLAYTPYDAIVLGGAEFSSMPPGVADAIWRYVECGGNLFVFGGGELPEPWRSRASISAGEGRRFAVGFGRCVVFSQTRPSQLGTDAIESLHEAADALARHWQVMPVDENANNSFRVVDKLSIPVRGIVFIMLAFVLIIGPANLLILSRLKRRTWLLWTVPAISFLTCLLVFAYSLLSEGVTPDSRIESVTLLDQVNRRATTLGVEAFYCPLTPNQGLRFGYQTEVTPLVEMGDYGTAGSQREVDWTQAQHFRRGWVTARIPAHFFVRKSETRRERLQVDGSGGQWTVVNGLSAPVRSLWLADSSGRIFSAETISAGERAVLSPSPDPTKVSGTLDVGDLLFKAGLAQQASLLTNNAVAYLRPGTYIAELEGNPFLENGLGSSAKPARTRSSCVVYGILE